MRLLARRRFIARQPEQPRSLPTLERGWRWVPAGGSPGVVWYRDSGGGPVWLADALQEAADGARAADVRFKQWDEVPFEGK